jgi:caffeoyl-CoA O-methyltransferase
MRPLAGEEIERYALEHSTTHSALMAALAEDAQRSLTSPQMLSGAVEGRLLEMLVFASGARSVLEIGTYAGYSALAMAAGLPDGGKIVSCEISQRHADFALEHIKRSPYAERIEVRVGAAIQTIAELRGPFDLVFIDADKSSYGDYYEAALSKLSPRGLIVIDNTLWSGRVLDSEDQDPDTRALRAFNEMLIQDERVICVMLTVRDGITLVRRRLRE